MACKGQPGLAGGLMELMARLPRWAGLVLAGVFYLVLHPPAERGEMVINGERYQSDPGFSARNISLTPVLITGFDHGFSARNISLTPVLVLYKAELIL